MSIPAILPAQEPIVPEWGILVLATLGACFLILIVLIPMAVARTQRERAAAQTKGIRAEGVRASKSMKLGISPEILREKIRSVVQNEKRFSRVEDAPGGVDVFVRGNMWTWGEVIDVRFSETADGTEVNATCRPRVPTTLFDYGQGGSDLGLFIDQLVQRVETNRPGDGL